MGNRLVLFGRDQRRCVLLADATAVALTRQSVSPAAFPSPRAIVSLAQADLSFGAWAVDLVSDGALGYLSSLAETTPTTDAPDQASVPTVIRWHGVTDALAKLTWSDLLPCLIRSIGLLQVDELHEQQCDREQRRSVAISTQASILAKPSWAERDWDVFWWARLLTAPLGLAIDDRQRWMPCPPVCSSLSVEPDHPLYSCLHCLSQSNAPTTMLTDSEEGTKDDHDAGDQTSRSAELAAWRAAVPEILRMADRCRRLENDFQVTLEHEKLLAMKELAYGASHEINNPLANISSRAQMLLRDEADPERRRTLSTINSQAFRAHEMIADMMLFAKPPKLQLETVDLADFVLAVVNQLEQELTAGVALTKDIGGVSGDVCIDSVQMAVVIRAIWANAVEAMGSGGELHVTARVENAAPMDASPAWAEIEITDNGPGIRPAVRQHLFDPFFSGREAGRGLGFGLAKAWRIVGLHDGQIVVSSQPGEGAAVVIRLPCSSLSKISTRK